jgi:hypothetical protein
MEFHMEKPYAKPLQRGDGLLVAPARRHISAASNISTQPTWSHSALYGELMAGAATEEEPNVLCEANIDDGVVSAPLSKYLHCQTHLLNDHRLLVNKSGD